MVHLEDWADRVLVLEFIKEQPSKGQTYKTRKFTKISGDVGPNQIKLFSKAISKLTPNGDGDVITDAYDHFQLYSDTDE